MVFAVCKLRMESSKNSCREKTNIDFRWNMSKEKERWIENRQDFDFLILTVLWGLIPAILKACSNEFSNGLQRIGVLGRSEATESWRLEPYTFEKNKKLYYKMIRDSPSQLFSGSSEALVGLSVSKQMMSSKQSSNPSLPRTLATWAAFPFENICHI